MKPNTNSFAAGFASALILVVIGSALTPAVQSWWNSVKGSGGMGMILLILAVGVGAWALGRTQTDGPGPGGGPSASSEGGPQSSDHSSSQNGYTAGGASQPPPRSGPQAGAAGASAGGQRPTGGWQRGPTSGAQTHSTGAEGAAKGAWERAREETKHREEERKAREAAQKRKEELEKKLREAREKETREREARERRQTEANTKSQAGQESEADKAKNLQREKDKEKAKMWEERKEETKRAQLERERLRKENGESAHARGSSYAFSAMGEKTNPWPMGRPGSPTANRSQPSSPTKRPPAPTAKTYRGTDDDAYSFRPYDKPKRPVHKATASSVYSESSYAASHSTSQTSPPPSQRGPYTSKDPNKIVIKAVYSFNNAFLKTPTSQLVSGVGSVTDGLILRITTEGLFIDDDVRGVPQREWDVKAWTMKLVEVWCPSFRQGPAGNSTSARNFASSDKTKFNPVRRLWGLDKDKTASAEETDALLVDMLQLCNSNCRSRAASSLSSAASDAMSDSAYGSSSSSPSASASRPRKQKTNNNGVAFQTGELKTSRLHVLRASIRDQDGKKYVFIIDDVESWKVAIGLQRLRKGTQVRALGVSGMSTADARGVVEGLGWG